MQYRALGRTGIKVSLICLGTMTFGGKNSQDEGFAQMDYALGRGVNFFDTAEMYAVPPSPQTYGRTEEIVGNWLAARKKRDKIVLATKIAGPGMPWIRGGRGGIDKKNVLAAVEDSLRRLRTDYIDLYQLHWPNRDAYHFSNYWDDAPADTDGAAVLDNFREVLETLRKLVKAGKIRAAGLSNETAWGATQYLRLAEKHKLPRMASIQNEYSLLKRAFEPDLAEVALREDVGLLAWSPLAGGLLSGKYRNGQRPPGSRWVLETRRTHRDTPQAHQAVDAYLDIAQRHGLDACQMALAFVNSRSFVTSTIIGATDMDQLRTNIDSADLVLDRAVLDEIARARQLHPMPF